MNDFFKQRGYTEKLLNKANAVVDPVTRTDILNKSRTNKGKLKKNSPGSTIPPQQSSGGADTTQTLVSTTSINAQLFTNKPVVANKRVKNIREHLVRANLNYPPLEATQGSTTYDNENVCTRRTCPICSLLQRNSHFKSSYTRRQYRHPKPTLPQQLELTNVVYLLTCRSCDFQYVGETKRSTNIRIKEHIADIKHKRDTPVAHHFNKVNHAWHDIQLDIIHSCKRNPYDDITRNQRRPKESY